MYINKPPITVAERECYMWQIKVLLEKFVSLLGVEVKVRGRIISIRRMKRSVFADLFSIDSKVQCRFDPAGGLCPNNGDLVEVVGKCVVSKSGESTIDVSSVVVVGKWSANIDFKEVSNGGSSPLLAFMPGAYGRFHYSQVARNQVRTFLTSEGYFEVQTPILGRNYNGGRSFPVSSFCSGNRIGFNRTTVEDRMQALIAMGYERVFQVGSVFRSGKELTFLEGYEAFTEWEAGKCRIKQLLASVVEKLIQSGIGSPNDTSDHLIGCDWLEVDFLDSVSESTKVSSQQIMEVDSTLAGFLRDRGVIKEEEVSPETIADELANLVAEATGVPTIVNGFPVWSSPLYALSEDGGERLVRSRMYIPGQKGGFEIGMQENNYERFTERISRQRKMWNLATDDDRVRESDLSTVISGGLPPTFGYGLSPDRLVKIWRQDCSNYPYRE